jgi:tetratricopeptide (TPR) repeat protein
MAWLSRGLLRSEQQSWDQAIADYTECLKLDPKNLPALHSRALAYHEEKEFQLAIIDLNEAIKIAPTDGALYHSRGRAYNDSGSYRAAIADHEKSLELEPTSERYHNQLAWLLASCPKAEYRDGPRAVQLARRGCELNGWQDGNIIDTLAAAYAECGQFDEAVTFAKQAVEKAPPTLVKDIRAHVDLFAAHQTVRAEPPPPPRGSPRPKTKATPWWKKKKGR